MTHLHEPLAEHPEDDSEARHDADVAAEEQAMLDAFAEAVASVGPTPALDAILWAEGPPLDRDVEPDGLDCFGPEPECMYCGPGGECAMAPVCRPCCHCSRMPPIDPCGCDESLALRAEVERLKARLDAITSAVLSLPPVGGMWVGPVIEYNDEEVDAHCKAIEALERLVQET